MGDIVNLRTVRKQRARDERSRDADARRIQFGRTKSERQQAESLSLLHDRRLEGHRREPDVPAPEDATEASPVEEDGGT
jgi:hypothetical protein